MNIFDSIVIGSGPCSEPVLFHLSKTNLRCLVIDSGDLSEKKIISNKSKSIKFNKNISPKQKLNQFKWFDKKSFQKINDFFFLRCKNFCYIYSFKSGGLSNSWGGGAFEWSSEEISQTTSIPTLQVLNSYKFIRERLFIKKINSFSKITSFANYLLKNKNKEIFFKPAQFFLNKKQKFNNNYYPFNQNLIWNSRDNVKNYIKDSINLKYKKNTTVLYLNKKKNYWELCCKENGDIIFIRTKSIILCAGALNSACLAFSGADIENINLQFFHNHAFLIPIFSLRKSIKSISSNYLEIPELAWKEKTNKVNKNFQISSGYFISSNFILRQIISKLPFKRNNFIGKIISFFLSKIGFMTIFMPSKFSNVFLKFKKIKSAKKEKKIYVTISNESNQKNLKKEKYKISNKIFRSLPKWTYVLNFLSRSVATGGDIHYASTLPDVIGNKSFFNTSSIGEIDKLPMVFSADPSRLAYLSSLPHTFTTMAIIDASMPKIIKKISKFI
tara:strand:- start:1459 stop:2955 length:1497 start_codon:yes stop_codon:yes gene_type:complete